MLEVCYNEEARWAASMAITEEGFALLAEAIQDALSAKGDAFNEHANSLRLLPRYASGRGDLSKRLRWDLFFFSKTFLNAEERERRNRVLDLTDAQIDTALKRIVTIKELTNEQA